MQVSKIDDKIDFYQEIEDLKIDDVEEENIKVKTESINDDVSIKYYLKEIAKIKLLTADEEKELAKRIEEGDEEALEKLVNSNLRLVVKIAKKYVSVEYPFIDIIQDGNLGLIKAAKKFDYRRDVRFSTYSSWWIKQTIQRSLALRKRMIRMPHRKEETLRKITKLLDDFYQKHSRYPSVGELSDQSGFSREEIDKILIASSNVLSMENPVGEDDKYQIENFIGDDKYVPEDLFIDSNLKEVTNEILSSLYPKERMILACRYGFYDGKKFTLKNMGSIFGISAETVRQIEIKALKKLKRNFSHMREYITV